MSRHVLHYVSADAPGDDAPWSVYRETYETPAHEEPIDGSQVWVSRHRSQDAAEDEARRLQQASKRVSVPVEVLLWVDVQDGEDDEVTERAHAALLDAIPGLDGRGTVEGLLFARDVEQRITYVTGEEADVRLDLAVRADTNTER